jgi:hypothetical protein
LRSNSDEQILFNDEHKDILSLSPSGQITRPETSSSRKTPPLEVTPEETEKMLDKRFFFQYLLN